MVVVKIRKMSRVVPLSETPKHEIWVSNLDLLAPRTHTSTVYVYSPNGSSTFFSPEALKGSLAKALVPFYPFAGQLTDVDGGRRVAINCNGAGAYLAEAEADCTIDEFGDFTPSLKIKELLVPRWSSEKPDLPCPLLLLQVTFFKCGGVCLGVGLHHTLCDGSAALHFISSWSNLARGLDVEVTPFMDRTLLRARDPPSILFEHKEYRRNPTGPIKPFASATLHLTRAHIEYLKKKAARITTTHTTYEVVAAHVWKCACMARELAADQETRVYITADARGRLRPPLPTGYLGNAIFTFFVAGPAGEITSKPMGHAASKIRAAVARLDDEYLRSSLDYLDVQEELQGLGRGEGSFPTTDLSIVSWGRLPIYDADLGWGRPVFMGPASFFYGGLAYIMPSAGKDAAGLSLAISLEEESMKKFKKLFYEVMEMDEVVET